MTGSQSGALVESAQALAEDQAAFTHERDVRLTLPEATMFIIGASGVLWVLLYGAFNALFG